MNLRICDGEGERIWPASVEVVEQAFAPSVRMRMGTEISLADGERWLAAVALGAREGGTGGETERFLLTNANGDNATLSDPVGRGEALRRFREFLLARAAQAESCRRIFP
jgi:hypothetical protein